MNRKIYQNGLKKYEEGWFVTIMTSIEGTSGTIEKGMRKTLIVRSDKCLYGKLKLIQKNEQLVVYEPLPVVEIDQEFKRYFPEENLINYFNAKKTLETLKNDEACVVVTVLEVSQPTICFTGQKLFISSHKITDENFSDGRFDPIINEAKALMGSRRFEIKTIEDNNGTMICALFEDLI